MLPRVDFCGREISRLIVGGNTISGTSHVNKQLDMEMEDYFTTQKVKEMLFNCQEAGINSFQFRADKHIMRIIREFRLEGGTMNWIAQSAREMSSIELNLSQMSYYKPALVYLHGYETDELYKAGKTDEIRRMLGVIKKSGFPAGLCTHMTEVLEYSEMHRWDVDFYMCSVYNITEPSRMKQSQIDGDEEALFVDTDVPLMYEAVRGIDKPCLVFKILGATRKCKNQETVYNAFAECYASIKKGDAAIVGMYPKETDQVRINVSHAVRAINSAV